MYIKCFLCNHVFLIMNDGYPVKTMKIKGNIASFFSGNTGFPKNNREKIKRNKNFKILFSLFLFFPNSITNSFQVVCYKQKPVYFFVSHFHIFRFYSHLPLTAGYAFFISRHNKDGFLFDQFLYFLFVTYKKPRFLFSGKIKMTRFGESLHKGYSHRYYNCRKVSYGVSIILLRKTFFLLLCVLLFHL